MKELREAAQSVQDLVHRLGVDDAAPSIRLEYATRRSYSYAVSTLYNEADRGIIVEGQLYQNTRNVTTLEMHGVTVVLTHKEK